MVAQERRDVGPAEQWYLRSLAISEKHGNEHGAAITYHHLGNVALQRRDFGAAEQWYLRSLAIEEKQGNEHGAASTYQGLSVLAAARQQVPEAGRLCLRALTLYRKYDDPHNAQMAIKQFPSLPRIRLPRRRTRTSKTSGPRPDSALSRRKETHDRPHPTRRRNALRILTTIARARSGELSHDLAGLRDALATEFDIAPPSDNVSPGDLARQALLVLAEDPATRNVIEAMALEESSVSRQTFDTGTSIALGAAAYYALSTALDIQYVKGPWSIKLKKKAADRPP
jgi:hypothetical protein